MEGRRSDFKLCLPFRQRRKGRLNKNGKGKRMGYCPMFEDRHGKKRLRNKTFSFQRYVE